jgi:hypothetical protein
MGMMQSNRPLRAVKQNADHIPCSSFAADRTDRAQRSRCVSATKFTQTHAVASPELMRRVAFHLVPELQGVLHIRGRPLNDQRLSAARSDNGNFPIGPGSRVGRFNYRD